LAAGAVPRAGAAAVDTLTGAIVAAPQQAGEAAPVAAVPLSLTSGSTGRSAGVLMAIAGLLLLCITVLPPLFWRRLRDGDAA
jgi:hypothetical protein